MGEENGREEIKFNQLRFVAGIESTPLRCRSDTLTTVEGEMPLEKQTKLIRCIPLGLLFVLRQNLLPTRALKIK